MSIIWAPDGVVTTSRATNTGGAELAVFGDGSGMVVKVPAGAAWIKGQYYELDAQLTLGPFSTADVTNPRIDRVVVRVDWTTNTCALTVLEGTAAVTPSPHSLAGTPGTVFDLPLAQVLIRAGATTILNTDVTDERVFTDLDTTTPAGAMLDWPTAAAPRGWLLCYGQALSRTTYARLFAVIGTTFGAPSVATFSLPDCRGRVMVTLDNLGGSAASRVPSATTPGGNGGQATVALTPTELPTHHHTGSSLTATSLGASSNHHHAVNPPATDTLTESDVHHHQVNPPSTDSGDEIGVHHHAGALQTGLTTDNGNNNHLHGAGTLGGTTNNPDVPHHHTSGVAGANFVPSTGLVSASQPGSDPTGDDTPAHKHVFTVTGNTANTTDIHSHGFSVPSAATGDEIGVHHHAVDIAAFDSLDESHVHHHTVDIPQFDSLNQSDDHIHTVTISGNTGDTGSGTAFDVTQPWISLGKIIKF